MIPTQALRVDAPAKINLRLRVLGRRSDGFHEIDTLFQAIALHDDVTVRRTEAGIRLTVEGADVGPIEENLAYRAARALLAASGADGGFAIDLVKRIPAGAGLGGGSSDAAAVLRAGDLLIGRPLPAATLAALAAELGSDVPFFLGAGPLATGTGRGERLEQHPSLPSVPVVVVLPPVHVSTREAYARLAGGRGSSGGGEPPCFAHVGGAPATWEEVALDASNDFEDVVPAVWPEIAMSLSALRDAGARPAQLSGSGGACFGIFPDEAAASVAAEALEEALGWPAILTRTLESAPVPSPPDRAGG